MADVFIVMDPGERNLSVIGIVCGLDGVVHAQPQDGVINCTLPAHHVPALRSSPGIFYVRQVHSYLSDAQVYLLNEESEN
jgi:hypothetical protein